MSGAPRAPLALVPHPDHPAAAVRSVRVEVTRAPDALALSYLLDGDLDAIRIPAPAAPAIAHGLWEHTCFEVFVAAAEAAAYHEVNLAPSGAWAAFAFRGYRDGAPLTDAALAPRIVVHRDAGRLRLDADVPLARLSSHYPTARLRLAVAAVVEDARGGRSYWALRHPPGRPDFHHRDGFALALET